MIVETENVEVKNGLLKIFLVGIKKSMELVQFQKRDLVKIWVCLLTMLML